MTRFANISLIILSFAASSIGIPFDQDHRYPYDFGLKGYKHRYPSLLEEGEKKHLKDPVEEKVKLVKDVSHKVVSKDPGVDEFEEAENAVFHAVESMEHAMVHAVEDEVDTLFHKLSPRRPKAEDKEEKAKKVVKEKVKKTKLSPEVDACVRSRLSKMDTDVQQAITECLDGNIE